MFYGAPPGIQRQAALLRKSETKAEKALWKEPSGKQQTFKFRRQHPIAQYIVDFYCHELKLVVEVDGGIHQKKENREYDQLRTEVLEGFGIMVVRFTNDEVLNLTGDVLKRIQLSIKRLQEEKHHQFRP